MNGLVHIEVDGRKFLVCKMQDAPPSVSISWSGGGVRRGTAEAQGMPSLPEDWWWVNRILVQPHECRSNGVGSELVRQLSIAAFDLGCRHLVVTPGGYVNTARDRRRQIAFYERNGFVWHDDVPFREPCKAMVLDLGG